MQKFFLLLAIFVWSSPILSSKLGAQELDQAKDYFTISSVTVKELGEEKFLLPMPAPTEDPEDDITVDKIINIGKKVWEIVKLNKPVVNIKTDHATAMPQGVTSWMTLENWQDPKAKMYEVTYKNGFGMTVVKFAFRVVYVFGGGYEGVGQYLARAVIVPANLDVAWGYTFNAKASVPSVLNAGTKEAPIGAAELEMEWTVDTVLKHHRSTVNYFIRGDGKFVNLNNGN